MWRIGPKLFDIESMYPFYKINESERYVTLSRHAHEMVNRLVHKWHIIVACPDDE